VSAQYAIVFCLVIRGAFGRYFIDLLISAATAGTRFAFAPAFRRFGENCDPSGYSG
jgi:hypothetical protein